MKTLPLSLNAHLREHSRLSHLFSRSNLACTLIKAIESGSLYLPASGRTLESAHVSHVNTMALGYQGEVHSFAFYMHETSLDYDDDEVNHHENLILSVPVKLVDSYVITATHPYKHNPTYKEEKMTFTYSKRTFNAWVKSERVRLRAARRGELEEKRKALNKEIAAL